LAFGLKPERLLDTEGRIDCFLEPPGAEQLDLLVKALRSGIEAGGALVAIVPDWFDPDGRMRLQMALSLVDSTKVALHATPLPPLAATVLASLASAAGPLLPSAGVLASVLPDIEARLQVVTWLGSVGGLTSRRTSRRPRCPRPRAPASRSSSRPTSTSPTRTTSQPRSASCPRTASTRPAWRT
jgi:hypothetical protein